MDFWMPVKKGSKSLDFTHPKIRLCTTRNIIKLLLLSKRIADQHKSLQEQMSYSLPGPVFMSPASGNH